MQTNLTEGLQKVTLFSFLTGFEVCVQMLSKIEHIFDRKLISLFNSATLSAICHIKDTPKWYDCEDDTDLTPLEVVKPNCCMD